MVPWHPPCALCSLIFSSLDPETNRFLSSSFDSERSKLKWLLRSPSEPNTPFSESIHSDMFPCFLFSSLPTGLCSKSFSVQLSRYSSGPGLLPFGFRPMSPENDTELFAILNSVPVSKRWLRFCETCSSAFSLAIVWLSIRSGLRLSTSSGRSTFGSASAFLLQLSP